MIEMLGNKRVLDTVLNETGTHKNRELSIYGITSLDQLTNTIFKVMSSNIGVENSTMKVNDLEAKDLKIIIDGVPVNTTHGWIGDREIYLLTYTGSYFVAYPLGSKASGGDISEHIVQTLSGEEMDKVPSVKAVKDAIDAGGTGEGVKVKYYPVELLDFYRQGDYDFYLNHLGTREKVLEYFRDFVDKEIIVIYTDNDGRQMLTLNKGLDIEESTFNIVSYNSPEEQATLCLIITLEDADLTTGDNIEDIIIFRVVDRLYILADEFFDDASQITEETDPDNFHMIQELVDFVKIGPWLEPRLSLRAVRKSSFNNQLFHVSCLQSSSQRVQLISDRIDTAHSYLEVPSFFSDEKDLSAITFESKIISISINRNTRNITSMESNARQINSTNPTGGLTTHDLGDESQLDYIPYTPTREYQATNKRYVDNAIQTAITGALEASY